MIKLEGDKNLFFYIKYYDGFNLKCASVKNFNKIENKGYADYYCNGDLFAQNKEFVLNENDILIEEMEFNKIINNEITNTI